MLDELLSPLRLPERAMGALSHIAEELSGLRADLASGVGKLDKATASLASDLRPMRTDVAVMRESTSRLPEGIAKLEKVIEGLGGKLEHVHEGVGTLHADMGELCAHIEAIGKQLAGIDETITGMKGSLEDVTKDLPGAGAGPIARMRDAIGGQST